MRRLFAGMFLSPRYAMVGIKSIAADGGCGGRGYRCAQGESEAVQAIVWLTVPPVPKRPSALAHLSDEAAARALARHFGDFVKAAKDLEVGRSDLRKLSWHNPRVLHAAHERIGLFHDRVRAKAIAALHSGNGRRQRWGAEVLLDSFEARGSPFCDARWSGDFRPPAGAEGAPVSRNGARPVIAEIFAAERARVALEQEGAAERAREAEADRQRELELERAREAEVEASRRRERTAALKPIPAGRPSVPAAQSGSLWPAEIRRPSRGGWR
jgi:hypothetical protein